MHGERPQIAIEIPEFLWYNSYKYVAFTVEKCWNNFGPGTEIPMDA